MSKSAVLELPETELELPVGFEIPDFTEEEAAAWFSQPANSETKYATYRVACRGLTPLKMDRMTETQVAGLVTGDKVPVIKDEPLRIKALRKCYSDRYENDMPVGDLIIPKKCLYAALKATGKKVKYGQGTWDLITSASNGTLLFAMMGIVERHILLRKLDGGKMTKEDFIVDCEKGNATQGTGAVGIIRPRFDEWAFVCHIQLAVSGEYVLPEAQLRKLFNMAGLRAGLCSGRPAMQMEFGQFQMTDMTWVGGEKPRATTIVIDETPPKPAKAKATRKKKGEAVATEGDAEATEGRLVNRIAGLEASSNGDGHGEEE